jgi:hypothetical protein
MIGGDAAEYYNNGISASFEYWGAGIPFRMRYPIDEQTLNGGSYSNAVSNQGPDTHDTRLWWDVN